MRLKGRLVKPIPETVQVFKELGYSWQGIERLFRYQLWGWFPEWGIVTSNFADTEIFNATGLKFLETRFDDEIFYLPFDCLEFKTPLSCVCCNPPGSGEGEEVGSNSPYNHKNQ